MALTTFERTEQLSQKIRRILTEQGFVDLGNGFMGQIVNAIQDALAADYRLLYQIAENVDIGRAAGEYLDRWGTFLNEPRQVVSYASDLSLSNLEISISPSVTAGTITTDGQGLTIPAGTIISDTEGSVAFETIDEVYIRPDRSSAFARIIALAPGEVYAPAGSLTTVRLSLSDLSNVMPSALNRYALIAGNTFAIDGGTDVADEETYRYVLLQRTKSLGLYNENRINALMDLTDVVSVVIREYAGGANVFLDTRNTAVLTQVVESARAALRREWGVGLTVNAYPPILRRLILRIRFATKNPDNLATASEQFKSDLVQACAGTTMGASLDLAALIRETASAYEDITNAKLITASYGGRTVVSGQIAQHFNERVTLAVTDIALV